MMDCNRIREHLTNVLSDDFIEIRAEELGVLERDRKIDVVTLVWTLILGWPAAAQRTLTSLRRAYMWAAGHCVARSSFYQRLSEHLMKLMESCLEMLLGKAREQASAHHGRFLRHFDDVLAIDSTVVRLHEMLEDVYPGCADDVASAKLDVVMNVADQTPNRLEIAEGKRSDQTFWTQIGSWVEDTLLLFDLGYYDFNFFHRIDQQGGRFITRLKSDANPTIVTNHRTPRGNAIELEGKDLQDVIDRLQRKRLDVTVALEVEMQKYRGTCSTRIRHFRMVGQRHDETGEYHLYLTNIEPDMLETDDISETYRLRWQMELMFCQLRSHARLDELPSQKEHVVRILIYASFLALLVSRSFLRELRSRDPGGFYPAKRCQAVFESSARLLLQAVGEARRDDELSFFEWLAYEVRDPNLVRDRGMTAMYPL
jgi:IS4 transposase